MSRYIDADAIKEKKWQAESEACFYALEDVVSVTDIDETDDAIELVRCKECRHWIGETEHYEDREYKACWQLCGQYMDSEFWCKYGEREDE